ncbi:SDR family oxidoreductase [Pontibacter ramchanderi]|uniref:Nucleoside-diphosphate-sugar epimerase n=1 Tax=Pontibacter ramchanderi TaxID=1179743 RepID=A0A2N3V1C8_9BACT|nr:SDR family oxidoreductase [Pontibacter ramchanderi]PKV75438.1 nucleoside-diphosphate-sugar epimerase [Pontibacter ramchanderi]
MQNKVDISVMGCGWLGLPLAERLVRSGLSVNGSTTSEKKLELLRQSGIQPFQVNLADPLLSADTLKDFLQADVLILNIPPKLRADGGESYLQQMTVLQKALLQSTVSRVLFVSSTSVYPDLNRIVTEEDTSFTDERDPDNTLLKVERMFQNSESWVCTVVRFGGLVGDSRQPGRFMAGKHDLPNGDAPVNLIHLEDCLNILERIITEEKWGQVYNACADEHPSRRDFYVAAAKALHLEAPTFKDMEETSFKLINSQKVKDDLAYVFSYPNPMAFF